MNIGFDATPAAVQTAGVGRYSRELLRAMVSNHPEHRYTLIAAAEKDQCDQLLDVLSPGAWREVRRLPARATTMTKLWQRVNFPVSLNHFFGDIDVYHGTDFVLPPIDLSCVVTVHDLSFLKCPQYSEPSLVQYLERAVPTALRRASAVIAVSATVAAEIVEIFPDVRERVFAIPNGVSIPESYHGKSLDDRPRILTVGTVEPRKNHLALINAMKQVWITYPEAELVIAGREGWQSKEIIAAISNAKTQGQVYWVKEPTDSEIDALYASADVAVYPSHYEGFGLPVLEAMAREVPVVASDTPVLRETGGNAAIFSAPDDTEALAGNIVRLIEDSSLRSDLVSRGIQRVHSFSWEATARKTVRAYEFAVHSLK